MRLHELISIIVPVYNADQYIERCIKSILSQIYSNIEVILVDDGSSDKSPIICDSYAATYSNIYVIHQKNAGVSVARNVGIQNSQGEWICLVDADDYISEHFIQELMELCKENNCECAVCHYVITKESHCKFDLVKDTRIVSGSEAVIEQFGSNSTIQTLAWNKLYQRYLFDGTHYPEGKINEDVFTTHELLYKAKRVVVSSSKLYAYYQSDMSIMRGEFSIKRLDILKAYLYRIDYYEKLGEVDIMNMTQRAYCNRLFDAYWICVRFLPKEKEIHQELRRQAKETYRIVRKIRGYIDLSKKRYWMMRLKQFIGRYFPLIYKVMFVKDKNYI